MHQDQVVSFLLGNAEDTVGSLPARSHLLRPLFQNRARLSLLKHGKRVGGGGLLNRSPVIKAPP